MPTAKVTLTKGPRSHTHRGRTFVRGKPQTVTTASEIMYYQGEYGFSVTILGGRDKKKEEKQEEKQEKKIVYTKEKLDKKKKPKLVAIADKLDVPLTGEETKDELVEAILLSQEGE